MVQTGCSGHDMISEHKVELAVEIHQLMEVYGDSVMSQQRVAK